MVAKKRFYIQFQFNWKRDFMKIILMVEGRFQQYTKYTV